MKKNFVRPIAESAVFVALAVVLDLLFKLIPFLNMPQGGHVSLAMLPIIIIGFRRGLKYGLISGLVYGIINFIFDGMIFHWGSIFFDYLFPFTCLGLSGLFKNAGKKPIKVALIILLLGFIRYVFHGLSGVLFFKEYALYYWEGVENPMTGEIALWVYSFIVYNLPFMALSTALCMVVGSILASRNLIYFNLETISE